MHNVFYLGVIQAGNYILPLITIPYLVRVLGTENFGLLSFAIAFIAYFQIAVDYGFSLSATREVSLIRNDRDKLSSLFFSVILVKSAISAVCAVCLIGLLAVFSRIFPDSHLYLFLFLGVVGNILFPSWLFQGKEEMGFITFFGLLGKVISTGLIFILIKKPGDYIWYAYLSSFTAWIVGITGFIVALKRYRLRPIFINRKSLWRCLKDGWEIFVSTASVSLFTNSNTFILGLFTNNSVVGMFAIADKIVRAVIYLCAPFCNAVFPRTSYLFSESRQRALVYLRKFLLAGSSLFAFLSAMLFILADLLVVLVSGAKNSEIALLIRIMFFLPLSVFIDNIFGTQIMLNCNLKKQFMRIILGGGIFSLMLLLILVPRLHAFGSAISFGISELFIVVLMILTVRKAGIRLFKVSDVRQQPGAVASHTKRDI